MMKKLAAALLAAAMTVSVGTVAFAAPTPEELLAATKRYIASKMTLLNGDAELRRS